MATEEPEIGGNYPSFPRDDFSIPPEGGPIPDPSPDEDGCGCYSNSDGVILPNTNYYYIYNFYSVSDTEYVAIYDEFYDFDGQGLVGYCSNGVRNGQGWSGSIIDSKTRIDDAEGNFLRWDVLLHSEQLDYTCCASPIYESASIPDCQEGYSLQFYRDDSHTSSSIHAGPVDFCSVMANDEAPRYEYSSGIYRFLEKTVTIGRYFKPYGVPEPYYDIHTVDTNILYTCQPCDDPDIPMPDVVEGFNYSGIYSQFDIDGLDSMYEHCSNVKGQIETAYLSCTDYYRCKSKPGWEWDGETWIPSTPGIPDGPTLKPPTVLPVDPATPGVCPDCYEYDAIQDVCIYVGGEGCEEPPCVVTAGCDAKPITGECIDRGDC